MAACLRSGHFLKIFRSREIILKSFSYISFQNMPLERRLVERLNNLGIKYPTEIQQKSLELLFRGDNVIINAETGSGKTLCYLLPVIDRLLKLKTKPFRPSTVIFVPNMDLGYQISSVVNQISDPDFSACPVHRNSPLRTTHPVIISTPQTLMQYNIKSFSSEIRTIIIDEADLLISNSGKHFWKQLKAFQESRTKNGDLSFNETNVQFIFVAATLPRRGEKSVFRKILNQFPDIQCVTSQQVHQYLPSLKNVDVFVKDEEKLPKLLKCLNILNGDLPDESIENLGDGENNSTQKYKEIHSKVVESEEGNMNVNHRDSTAQMSKQNGGKDLKVLLFANTIAKVRDIYEFLSCKEGRTFEISKPSETSSKDSVVLHRFYKNHVKTTLTSDYEIVTKTGATEFWRNKIGVLHKDMTRSEREETLRKFRENEIVVLVSTDLASRGLDIANISHVLQVDFARNAADTLHRAGRTARAGNQGTVINFVTQEDKDLWRATKLTEKGIGPEGFQEIFSRSRQFSRRIKQRMSHIH